MENSWWISLELLDAVLQFLQQVCQSDAYHSFKVMEWGQSSSVTAAGVIRMQPQPAHSI